MPPHRFSSWRANRWAQGRLLTRRRRKVLRSNSEGRALSPLARVPKRLSQGGTQSPPIFSFGSVSEPVRFWIGVFSFLGTSNAACTSGAGGARRARGPGGTFGFERQWEPRKIKNARSSFGGQKVAAASRRCRARAYQRRRAEGLFIRAGWTPERRGACHAQARGGIQRLHSTFRARRSMKRISRGWRRIDSKSKHKEGP